MPSPFHLVLTRGSGGSTNNEEVKSLKSTNDALRGLVNTLQQQISDEATLTKAKMKELERKNEALKKEIHDILNDNPPNKGKC